MKKIIENGIEIFEMNYSDISKCPNIIFDPNHYINDSCLCFDKNAKMKSLGYKWNKIKGHWD